MNDLDTIRATAETRRTGPGSRAGIRIEAKRQAEPWRQIEHEAREEVRAALPAIEALPLAFGAHVAWAVGLYGHTDGISPLHRVGTPLRGESAAICGEIIPAAWQRLTLSPSLVQSMARCRYCEDEYTAKGHPK